MKKVLAFSSALLMWGCAARVQHVTDLPPGITEQQVKDWDAEVAALHKIASATSSIRQAVIDLHNAGAFPDSPAYIKVLQSIGKVDQLEQAAAEYLQQTPKTFGQPQKDKVKALVAQIGNELNDLANLNYFGTGTKARQYIGEALAAFNLALSLTTN
jgi:hypothetical protein